MWLTINKSLKSTVSWTLGSTDTGLTVSSWLVWQWEFTQISSDHIELDFDWIEDFSTVDSNNVANHFWHDDAVSKMGFDCSRLFTGLTCLLSLNAFHIKSVISVFNFYIGKQKYFWRIFFFVWLWKVQRFSQWWAHQFVQGWILGMNISEFPFPSFELWSFIALKY